MTKEQVIERLKKLDYLLDDVYSTGLVEDEERNKYQDAIETVLPMLEEKDKQIDKLKKHNDDLLRKLRNRVKDVKKLQKYILYKKEFSRLNKQLQNKNKIIDLIKDKEHINTIVIHKQKLDYCDNDKCKDKVQQIIEQWKRIQKYEYLLYEHKLKKEEEKFIQEIKEKNNVKKI